MLSPDGSRIAYSSDADGDAEIFVAAADGTSAVQLTANSAADTAPAFSPDGATIAYATDSAPHLGQIAKVVIASKAKTLLTDFTDGRAGNPDFAPDGSRIVFDKTLFDCCGTQQIWSMGSDGAAAAALPGLEGAGDPSYSPDGAQLALHLNRGPGELGVAPAAAARLPRSRASRRSTSAPRSGAPAARSRPRGS